MECLTSTDDAWENFKSNNFSKIDQNTDENEVIEKK